MIIRCGIASELHLQSPKLLDPLREALRYKLYSIRTEKVYVYWARLFIRFHGLKDPKDMGGADVMAIFTWLTNERKVAVSTHKQALSALLFLYRVVLKVELPWMGCVCGSMTSTLVVTRSLFALARAIKFGGGCCRKYEPGQPSPLQCGPFRSPFYPDS